MTVSGVTAGSAARARNIPRLRVANEPIALEAFAVLFAVVAQEPLPPV